MDVIASILGAVGMFIGYMIPWLSVKIMEYKKRSMNDEKNQFYTSLIKIVLCLINGVAWYYAFISVDSIIIALFISVQITLGIIFAYIDIKTRIIPNELVLILFVMGIIFQTVNYGLEGILGSLICMAFIMVVFTAVAGFMGFGKVGAGDVKLAGAIGFVLGYPLIITAMGAMAIILLLYILVGLAIKKIQLTTMLPLAPFIAAGYVFALFNLINKIKI